MRNSKPDVGRLELLSQGRDFDSEAEASAHTGTVVTWSRVGKAVSWPLSYDHRSWARLDLCLWSGLYPAAGVVGQ